MNTRETFTGKTKVVNGVTYHEYVDTDIMGHTSLQWMSDAIYNMSEEEAMAAYQTQVADDLADQAAQDAADAQKDADGERITAELIAMRDNGTASIETIKSALGKYVTMPADEAPFDLSDLVLAVQEGYAVERKLANLKA